ncbi:M56 family metallopeptidase [Croceitalea rosinachiae]|uniref:M56 family metallopeptidase n=1 Tax=Croceitalea rosinachiae TaxID=3075596 RepID=A0ABU3A730_9FLAO|nr:M56 family metallopeptidase [Croceitalea sp. F388]MDT0605774.1 M56 family metallopeptidase [Croceitalea sp. F388]
MLLYLLKSAACMAIFLLFYKLLLEKEQMHIFKRFYLLAGLIASLVIPSLVFVAYIEPTTTYATTQVVSEPNITTTTRPEAIDVINWILIVKTIYALGLIGFGFQFFKNLLQIINRIRKNPKLKQQFSIKVLLKEQLPPHTFFRYVFLNKIKFEEHTIPDEVLLHEDVHAKQCHSIDVVFIELLQVILWFNPMVFFFKKCIKLNHEFLADSAVLKKTTSTSNYQNTLLSYLSRDSHNKYQSIKMANAINYSSIKKRFKIMKKETSKRAVLLRSILVVPLFVILLYGFSETKSVQKKEKPNNTSINNNLYEKNVQEGASRKLMAEYNALAKKYNEMDRDNMRILGHDVARLEYIYGLMSDKQKADAEPFPDFPEPPPAPKAPRIDEVSPSEPISKVSKEESIEAPKPPSPKKVKKAAITPPAPPEPLEPLDHVIEMAKRGATFYLEDKKISSAKAIELLKKDKSLNISTTGSKSKNPQVRISEKPITIKKSSASRISIETGSITVNGNELFYSTRNGITSYFNEKGEQVNRQGQKLEEPLKKNPTFYFNGNRVSSVKARQLLQNNKSIQVATEDFSEDEYAIVLTDLSKVSHKNYNKSNNPNSVIDLTEMIEKEASFFYNDEPISTERALWLTKNTQIERVNTKGTKNGKPKVYFWKKA